MLDTASQCHRVPANTQRSRRALFASVLVPFLSLAGCQSAAVAPSGSRFPAVGRKLLFTTSAFRSELHFHSISSLTYYLLGPDGSLRRTEQVEVSIQEVADGVFLATWQEASKTTVVQVQDFVRKVLFTNITRPDGTFTQVRGTFELSGL